MILPYSHHNLSAKIPRPQQPFSVDEAKIRPPHPESATILHQPRKSQKSGKNRKIGENLNGISVSETPKIGERPYPRPFHPVEITPNLAKIAQIPHKIHKFTAQITPKLSKNPIHQVLKLSLDRGTDAISCLHYIITLPFANTKDKKREYSRVKF